MAAAAAASLIPELEDVVQHGTPERRAETLRRVTALFLGGADQFSSEHVALFDDVIGCLIEQIETKALAELARRIAPVANPPREVTRALARHDDISVAGPVLQQAQLDDPDLRYIAETRGQGHLLALSTRRGIGEALADILVERGDREVTHSIAGNHQARLSEGAFGKLVERAADDGALAEHIALRTDIPPRLFRQLLLQATEVVQNRLLARATTETQSEIRKILTKVSREVGVKAAPRSFGNAVQSVRTLHQQRKLTEADVVAYAKDGKYEETIAALAMVCAVPVEIVDRLMGGDRHDPILILVRSASFGWETARVVIMMQPAAKGSSPQAIETARENFDRITAVTAQRVVRFWQVREGTGQ